MSTTTEKLIAQQLEWLESFEPRRFLRNGHIQTIAGNFLPRKHPHLPPPEECVIEVEPGTSSHGPSSVLCHCHWQPEAVRSSRATIILLHGLEGSSQSQYVVGNAARAWSAGMNVVRMNMRNCGGTEHLSLTLYHSGFSSDVATVMEHFAKKKGCEQFALVGYSMGGNLVLKLVGELGNAAPAYLKAVVGVSPAMDLAASADALHEPRNRIYEQKFLRSLLKRFARKAQLYPDIYRLESSRGVRTIREFDHRITAEYSGFSSADDYYKRSSSAQFASSIKVPTLIMHALDDPFVRMLPQTRTALLANPHVRLIETDHGGHCAFLEPRTEASDGYWAERILLQFILARIST